MFLAAHSRVSAEPVIPPDREALFVARGITKVYPGEVEVVAFACVRILRAVGGSDKYVEVQMTLGCDVAQATTGSEGLAAIEQSRPDVLLTDYLMPGMTGAELARSAGLDTYITGEGPHHTYFDAVEWGLNVIYAGHYATETLGVQAQRRHGRA